MLSITGCFRSRHSSCLDDCVCACVHVGGGGCLLFGVPEGIMINNDYAVHVEKIITLRCSRVFPYSQR